MSSARSPAAFDRSNPPPRKDSLQNRPTFLTKTSSTKSNSSSDDSTSTARSPTRPPAPSAPTPYGNRNAPASASTSSFAVPPRPIRKYSDAPPRESSPAVSQPTHHTHRRQHSQGFFEPTLPITKTPSMHNLSASQIAAQAAMHVQNSFHARRRSQTIPEPTHTSNQPVAQRKPSNLSVQTASDSSNPSSRAPSQTRSGSGTGNYQTSLSTTTAFQGAVAAVNAKSPLPSPALPQQGYQVASPTVINNEKEGRPSKEKSRMKIFSKPKALNVGGHKDPEKEKKSVTIQSPKKPIFQTMPSRSNQRMISLTDPIASSSTSIYSTGSNQSSSTLVPADKEKEKHRHNFLARQRNKLKEGAEHYSSAASNSRPTDPNGPQPLYSFAPSSPGPGSTFNITKSKTGLDLRHGGRALREKKREEKAAAGTFVPPAALVASEARDREPPSDAASIFGPPSSHTVNNAELASGLGAFGLPGMTLDDAWPLLKARLLYIFEGEEIRTPIEDFNKLVLAHLQRCIQRQTPSLIIEDLRELLETGFYSLDQTLRRIPDERLVPHLVATWSTVFGTVLPFVQAVFHPLDLEFKGSGQILSPKEARDFWGALPFAPKQGLSTTTTNTSNNNFEKPKPNLVPLHTVLSVRTITLLTFRDTIILPRYDLLLTTFSRLPLENLNATAALEASHSPPTFRPGTAASSNSAHNLDPITASFNSQSSTLLDSSNSGSLGARSRATSNTSAMSTASGVGSFHSMASQRPHAGSHGSATGRLGLTSAPSYRVQPTMPALDSAQVTQTAGRMLQCVSVLASLQTPGNFSTIISGASAMVTRAEEGEDAEAVASRKMERLGRELKLNWLGRSRTGRNRRGLVGTMRTPVGGVVG